MSHPRCYAHEHRARVTLRATWPGGTAACLANATSRAATARANAEAVADAFADGVNFDYESPTPVGSDIANAYTGGLGPYMFYMRTVWVPYIQLVICGTHHPSI